MLCSAGIPGMRYLRETMESGKSLSTSRITKGILVLASKVQPGKTMITKNPTDEKDKPVHPQERPIGDLVSESAAGV